MLAIINDILDFSKIDTGKLELENVDFDVREFIEKCADLVAESAHGKHLKLRALVESGVPQVLRGDPGRLRQVLLNLLSNAIKFTATGCVDLHVQPGICVEVRDTGIGLPEEARSRIFQSFTQAEASTTRRYGGTGLGLSISKRLVELMGGRIAVESTPGAGSTFWIEIPLPAANSTPPAPSPGVRIPGTRVLVVDESVFGRRIVRQMLESFGATVEEASSASEALGKMTEAKKHGRAFRVAIVDSETNAGDGSLARGIQNAAGTDPFALLLCFPYRIPVLSPKPLGQAGAYGRLMNPLRRSMMAAELARVLGLASKAPPPARTKLVAAKVLVADDNLINHRLAKIMLERLGCDVSIVADGAAAIEAWSKGSYDVIFMDCQMPELDGMTATREIRRQEHPGHRIPIVAVMANDLPGEREKCLAGMDDYLAKPIRPNLLSEIVLRCTSRRAAATE